MDEQTLIEFKLGDTATFAKVRDSNITSTAAIYEFGKLLNTYVEAHPGIKLCLDLSQVQYFSSAVLTDLIHLQAILRRDNGSLSLRGVHGNVREIMKLTRTDKMFKVVSRHHSHSLH